MRHKRFEENILMDEAYTNYGTVDKNADNKNGAGIAKNFAENLEYGEKKKWYQQMPEEPATITKTLTQDKIEEMRKEASSALHGDTLAYETKSSINGSSDHQWAHTLLNKGAIGDRVAAATILIQDNPIYNLTVLTNLVNNVKPAKKKDGLVIIEITSEWSSHLSEMVFKLSIVILTLLVLDTTAQRLNRLQIDLYKYGFIKNYVKRLYNNGDDVIETGTMSNVPCIGKGCNHRTPLNGILVTGTSKYPKRASEKLDLMNLLRSLHREEILEQLEPVIFLAEEFDDRAEK